MEPNHSLEGGFGKVTFLPFSSPINLIPYQPAISFSKTLLIIHLSLSHFLSYTEASPSPVADISVPIANILYTQLFYLFSSFLFFYSFASITDFCTFTWGGTLVATSKSLEKASGLLKKMRNLSSISQSMDMAAGALSLN